MQKTNLTKQFLHHLINFKFFLPLKYYQKSTKILDMLFVSKAALHSETYVPGTKNVVMFWHLFFDDEEHWRPDDPAIFIEQQSQRAKPRELMQMLMKH